MLPGEDKEVTDANLEYTQEELITFTSSIYNFPKDEFDKFKEFGKEEGLEIDVILDQLTTELYGQNIQNKSLHLR